MSRKIPTGSSKGRRVSFDEERIEDLTQKDGKYKIRLPSKSRSDMYSIVLKIINNYPNWYEDNLLYVSFNEPNDDLKKVIEISKEWKAFGFYFGDEELTKSDFWNAKYVMFCNHKNECNGICMLFGLRNEDGSYGHKTLSDLKDVLSKNQNEEARKLSLLINRTWVKLDEDNDNNFRFSLDKEELLDIIINDMDKFIKYCEILNVENIKKIIKSLPSQLTIKKTDELLDEYEALLEEEKFDHIFENKTKAILSEEQLIFLAEKIADNIEVKLRKLFKDAKLL